MRFYRTVQELARQIGEKKMVSYEDIPAVTYFDLMKGSFPCHFGQKKLFYALLEFLTICKSRFDLKECLLVYIGAAPCDNLQVILPLFPELLMDLYDPATFHIKSNRNVSVFSGRQGFVTDATLPFIQQRKITLKKRHILLMSDIRRSTDERNILTDMRSQERWAQQLQASAISLKFRAPYRTRVFRYIKGQLYFQIRAPVRSAELRLIAFLNQKSLTYEKTDYDATELDAIINFHNIYVRTRSWHAKAATCVKRLDIGLGNDYEGLAEYQMIKAYLSCRGILATEDKILTSIYDINKRLIQVTRVDTRQSCQLRTMKKWIEKHKEDLHNRDKN